MSNQSVSHILERVDRSIHNIRFTLTEENDPRSLAVSSLLLVYKLDLDGLLPPTLPSLSLPPDTFPVLSCRCLKLDENFSVFPLGLPLPDDVDFIDEDMGTPELLIIDKGRPEDGDDEYRCWPSDT